MNEKIKSFFVGIGVFFAGIGTGILAILCHNRRATNTTREQLTGATDANRQAQCTVGELRKSVESSQTIIDDIRKQRIEDSVDY